MSTESAETLAFQYGAINLAAAALIKAIGSPAAIAATEEYMRVCSRDYTHLLR
jgi:hypothetical protein